MAPGDGHVTRRNNGCEMPHWIVAAAVDQGNSRARLEPPMAFRLLWSAEKHKLYGVSRLKALDQLEVTFFAPLFELPPVPCACIQSDDRARKIDAQLLQMHSAARALFFAQFQDEA